jgi:asparagine synthase (glutamine-hydrolysing)
VETRLPFLDPRLVEFGVNLPLSFKLSGGWSKYIVRSVSENYLNKSISWRKEKFGFEAPTKTWFSTFSETMFNTVYESTFLDKYVDKDVIKHNYPSMSERNRWTLFNVAVWSDVFKMESNG